MEVMKLNELLNYLNNYTKKRKNKHRFSAVMVCLAVIVSFTVSVGLIEPAESASGELICGMEEHEHTQDCFELICGFDEETEEEIVVETMESDSEETTETTTSTEETTTADTETATTDIETTETIVSTCTDESAPVSVHVHSDECYRLICLTEAHLHKQDCYNQPVETEPVTTEISTSASTSTGTDTIANTEQTTESTTTTTELSEEVYELNAALFGELYMDRVNILADAQTITKDGEEYPYYLIDEYKFYYKNGNLHYNEYYFKVNPNPAYHPACNITDVTGVTYNNTTYKTVYTFERNTNRYIKFKSQNEDGTLIFVFNKTETNVKVQSSDGTLVEKEFNGTEDSVLTISVKANVEYTLSEPTGTTNKARLAYAEFIPAVKTEEYKFYYDDEKILHYNECFSYPDGTDGPNANTVTPNLEVVYNGNTYTNTYNFNKTDARYITLTAPQNGTLLMAFDGGTYDINVLKTGDTEPKSYSCNNSDQNVIAVPVAAGGEYKIYQNANDDNKARLAYAEFVPTLEPNTSRTYRIRNVKTGLYVEMDNDGNIIQGSNKPSGDMRNDFTFISKENYYCIRPEKNTNLYVDLDKSTAHLDTTINTISTYTASGSNNQQFKFIENIIDDTGNGTYKIYTRYDTVGNNNSEDEYCWEVFGNGAIKNAAKDTTNLSQDFIFVEATEIIFPKADLDTDNPYLLRNVRSRQFVHKEEKVEIKDANGNTQTLNNQIIQQKDIGTDSQFKFVPTGVDGEYYIVSGDSALTSSGIESGADVDYSDFHKSDNQKFYAEKMDDDSVRFYQINNGVKYYLGVKDSSTSSGAHFELKEAERVNDYQCFFIVLVPKTDIIQEGETRIEARVIFADYNDGKVTDNMRNIYDEAVWTPTFSLYKNDNKIETEKSNLVIDVTAARKDWCYQYNYVWYQNDTDSQYHVALEGVNDETKQVVINNKTFNVYYLDDTYFNHPGSNSNGDVAIAPTGKYKQNASEFKKSGDQIIYIFLDPVVERWWNGNNAPSTINISMKKRWDGYNEGYGFQNRPKEKIKVQLQRWDETDKIWKAYTGANFDDAIGREITSTFQVVDENKENRRYVNKEALLIGTEQGDYVKRVYTAEGVMQYEIWRTKVEGENADKKLATKEADYFSYSNLLNNNWLFTDEQYKADNTNNVKCSLHLIEKDWNNIILSVNNASNPSHFEGGFYFNWGGLPYGNYRVVETQSFYDANDNDVFDAGDRDTSQEYYYMSYPPMRDSRGVLHIQNFTKDMVIEVQKKWQDDEGGDMMLTKPIEFEVYRCLDDPRNSVPENLEPVGKFTTNENGYAFITSREKVSGEPDTSGYYYNVDNMETKNGDTKYHYFIKEIVPDGYKLINGNEKGYVLKNGSTTDYSVDYEDGDSRKFIITNKAKIGLRVEKEWYYHSVSDENKIDYYNNNTDNPIYPKFKIYKGDRPGTPEKNSGSGYSVNGSDLTLLKNGTEDEFQIGSDGYFELVSDEKDKHGDSSYFNDELNMLSDTKYELYIDDKSIVNEGVFEPNSTIINDFNENVKNGTVTDYFEFKSDMRQLWVKPSVNGTLYLKFKGITGEIEVYDRTGNQDVGKIGDYKIEEYNGEITISGLKANGNYRIRRKPDTGGTNINPCLLYASFTNDAYYYIQEITNDNSNYTLSNGDNNGFVEIGDNFYTTITANNRYPVVTAQNIPKVNLDITKEWYADADMEKQLEGIYDKSMKFKIYKAFAQGTPKETTVDNTASCYLESGNTTCSLIEYTDDIKVKNDSTTTATVSRLNEYYTTPADGKLSIIELPAYDSVTENDKTIYKKVYYYIQEADGNFKLLKGNDCGFVQNGGNTYGTSFEDNGNYIFKNQPTIDLTINKIWKDANEKVIENKVDGQIKFELYQTTNESPDPSKDTKIVNVGDKTATNGLFETKNYTITFENLPAYDLNGNLYRYYIKEETSTISATHVTTYNGKADFTEVVIVWNKYGAAPKIEIVNKEIPISYELPVTGGSGTHGYTAAGGTVVLLSAAVLLLKRRKKTT